MSENKHKLRKGQSTVEYIIVVTGVVALMIALLDPGNWNPILEPPPAGYSESPLRKGVTQSLNLVASGMEEKAVTLAVTRPAG